MGKANGKTQNFAETMIHGALMEENRSITKKEFDQFALANMNLYAALQEQIISLDVTIALLIESLGRNITIENNTLKVAPWSKEQVAQFKAEVKRRVEEIAEKMKKAAEEQKKRVVLVQ